MIKKKNLIIIVILILVVIGLICLYLELTRKERVPWELNLNQEVANTNMAANINQNLEIVAIADNINWEPAKFPNDYHHDLEIWYPQGWQFDCCGDTDSFSRHSLTPNQSFISSNPPHIAITDLLLASCPANNPECSIDQIQPRTSQQLFNERKAALKDYQEVQLKNFKLKALSYQAEDIIEPEITRNYLIDTGKGVTLVSFFKAEKFGEDFIRDFLDHLQITK